MRFLLFNIVVAGALVFLFASDKADLHAAADRAHDAANDIKSKAFEVVGAKVPARPAPGIKTKPTGKPVKPEKAGAPRTETPSAASTATAPEETFSQNKPLAPAAAEAVREVQVATRKLVTPVPSRPQAAKSLPRAIEQRREEILAEGIVGAPQTEAQKFMPATTRKRDLMLLSEEMELFSAKAISR